MIPSSASNPTVRITQLNVTFDQLSLISIQRLRFKLILVDPTKEICRCSFHFIWNLFAFRFCPGIALLIPFLQKPFALKKSSHEDNGNPNPFLSEFSSCKGFSLRSIGNEALELDPIFPSSFVLLFDFFWVTNWIFMRDFSSLDVRFPFTIWIFSRVIFFIL